MSKTAAGSLVRKRNAIIGAAVADAASLGFHWLYDQPRIAAAAHGVPEFNNPDAANYADVPGYFAHGNKRAGDFSQYGEQLMVMLRSLVENNGQFDQTHYQNSFIDCFGYGGTYVGYIDHPTRDTLNNIAAAEAEVLNEAQRLPFDGDDTLKRKLITKVLGHAKQANGEALRSAVEASVRATDNNDYYVEHALNIVTLWESLNGFLGADDTQLPALSKLPPLVSQYCSNDSLNTVVNAAVRVTNNNNSAVAYGAAAAVAQKAAIETGSKMTAVNAISNNVNSAVDSTTQAKIDSLLSEALSLDAVSVPDATAQWGMACQLENGFPSIVHNVATSGSYSDAVRYNILAGGDSCGRSVVLGAIMGACCGLDNESGIPAQWLERTNRKTELLQYIDALWPL